MLYSQVRFDCHLDIDLITPSQQYYFKEKSLQIRNFESILSAFILKFEKSFRVLKFEENQLEIPYRYWQ